LPNLLYRRLPVGRPSEYPRPLLRQRRNQSFRTSALGPRTCLLPVRRISFSP
jgi:hypothetical protein